MAKLNKQDVLHVAKLAKLKLTDAEVEKFLDQLSSVINHFEELNEVDTSNTEPTNQTTGLENVFRNDEIKSNQIFSQDTALSGSEEVYNGYFKVPAILSERSDK